MFFFVLFFNFWECLLRIIKFSSKTSKFFLKMGPTFSFVLPIAYKLKV